jgi:hypothetical protein
MRQVHPSSPYARPSLVRRRLRRMFICSSHERCTSPRVRRPSRNHRPRARRRVGRAAAGSPSGDPLPVRARARLGPVRTCQLPLAPSSAVQPGPRGCVAHPFPLRAGPHVPIPTCPEQCVAAPRGCVGHAFPLTAGEWILDPLGHVNTPSRSGVGLRPCTAQRRCRHSHHL